MPEYFFLFFLFLSFIMFIGRLCLLYFKKYNIDINFLSLHLVFGLFFLGSLSFVYNFFSGISDNLFIYILSIILFFSFFFILVIEKNYKIIFKYLFVISILSFLFLFYSNQLPPGYDAGLYHIPHQVFIQNEKIILGLVNMHSRFGLSSFYNYVAAIFWRDNNFTLVSFLQATYLIIFFIFLYELIEKRLKIFNIIVLSTLLTMPIWFRYNIPGYSLVDLPYGVFFYLSIILSLLIFVERSSLKNTYVLYFIFCCSLAFMHKSNGAQLLPLFIITLFFFLYHQKTSYTFISKILLIPTIVVLLWVVRTTIISGCLIYPVEITCFNFFWVPTNEARETFTAIKDWAFRGYSLLSFELSLKYILLIFTIIIFLFFFKIRNFYFKLFYNKKILLIFCSICLLFLYSQAESLQGFSSLLTEKRNNEVITILQKEIFLLLFSYTFSFLFSIALNNFQNNHNSNIKINFFTKVPFIFLVFYLITWITTAPNPRFAFSAFALILPLFITFFFPNFLSKTNNVLSNFAKGALVLAVLKFTLLEAIILNKLNFEIKKIPEAKTIKRSGFGRVPVNIIFDNRCWTIKYCYFYEKDIEVLKSNYGYTIYYKN
jgi:hypothetical protein